MKKAYKIQCSEVYTTRRWNNSLKMSGGDNSIQEIAAGLRSNKAQLELVITQLNQLQRQKLLAQVTAKELSSYPVGDVWRSCGKMFITQDKQEYTEQLTKQEKTINDQIKALMIKKNYIETTLNNAMDVLRKSVQQQ
ncbi:prefolding complex chaperone subunit Ecym_8120 [Eremothecium cymbalariae DBVPG|uniref:Prefoldin subunit 1 n=1 Tax=Eremothecium cymbalariae (strain CBS 270.75 / DBVPG 7215 / KCTC 17166 / NRRL Y-17582) TaxID=931890 RepID=G8JX37_ERECY|nr:Hypothetical protein Ecym_8120 [Eremothecium cymbalariae DBVPG\